MDAAQEIIEHARKQLEAAAIHLVGRIKENLNTTGNPIGTPGGSYHNQNPSNPGEFPHKMLGDLQRSITYEKVTDSEVRVGTNVEYGKYLEFGTTKMAARPWLRTTLDQEKENLEIIVGKPLT